MKLWNFYFAVFIEYTVVFIMTRLISFVTDGFMISYFFFRIFCCWWIYYRCLVFLWVFVVFVFFLYGIYLVILFC